MKRPGWRRDLRCVATSVVHGLKKGEAESAFTMNAASWALEAKKSCFQAVWPTPLAAIVSEMFLFRLRGLDSMKNWMPSICWLENFPINYHIDSGAYPPRVGKTGIKPSKPGFLHQCIKCLVPKLKIPCVELWNHSSGFLLKLIHSLKNHQSWSAKNCSGKLFWSLVNSLGSSENSGEKTPQSTGQWSLSSF